MVVPGIPTGARGFSWRTEDGEVVPDEEVVSLTYVQRGRGLLQGAGIGAVAGFGLGATIGLASGDEDCSGCLYEEAADKALIGGFVVGALGLGAGAILGLLVGSRDVYEAPASHAPRLTVQPTTAGGAAALTWTF